MPVMDEFKEEREALKNGPLRDKIKYFIYYYKWHTIAALAAIFLVVTLIHDIVTAKDAAFYAAFINGTALDNAEEFNDAFIDYAGIDTNEYDVIFDTTMYLLDSNSGDQMSVAASQKLVAYMASGELDIFGANYSLFSDYAHSTYLYDLRDVLTEEQLEACEPYLYYVDRPVVEAIEEAESSLEPMDTPEIPDPSKPEEMEDPIPIGLFTDKLSNLTNYYFLSEEGSAVGIPVNTKNLENAVKFIEFITR